MLILMMLFRMMLLVQGTMMTTVTIMVMVMIMSIRRLCVPAEEVGLIRKQFKQTDILWMHSRGWCLMCVKA